MSQSQTDHFSRYQRMVLLLLMLVQFTVIMDFMIIAPLGDFLMKSLSITTQQFGIVVSSYAFSAAIAGVVSAGFIDKFDRKQALLLCYLGFILGTLGCALSHHYLILLLSRVVTGVFAGITTALTLTIVADVFSVSMRGRAMSGVQMGFAISQIIGIPVGIFIANSLGWNNTFTFIVILALLICLGIFWQLKPINEHLSKTRTQSAFRHLWQNLCNKEYQIGFMAIGILTIGGFLMMPFSAVFLVNNVQITYDQLPIIFLSSGLTTMIIMPIVGILSDKFDRFYIFTAGSLGGAIMVYIYTHMENSPLWWAALVNILLFAAIMSRLNPAMAINSMVPKPQDRGAYMSICSSLQQVSGGIASIAAGMVVYQPAPTHPLEHYDTLGYVAIGIFFLGVLLMYRVSLRLRNQTIAP